MMSGVFVSPLQAVDLRFVSISFGLMWPVPERWNLLQTSPLSGAFEARTGDATKRKNTQGCCAIFRGFCAAGSTPFNAPQPWSTSAIHALKCCELFSRRTFSKAGIARVLRVWPDWHRLLRPNSRSRVARFLEGKVLARLPS